MQFRSATGLQISINGVPGLPDAGDGHRIPLTGVPCRIARFALLTRMGARIVERSTELGDGSLPATTDSPFAAVAEGARGW